MTVQTADITHGGHTAKLHCYVLTQSLDNTKMPPRPAVVICPGGGYGMCSEREAEPVALRFLAAGFNAYVLFYTVAPQGRFPSALHQLAEAVAYVRAHAGEHNTDPGCVGTCGFSAGGHLAASLGVFWHDKEVLNLSGTDSAAYRPNFQILCYPVLSTGEFGHGGSFVNLLGQGHTAQQLAQVSLENKVSPNTPPTFLWHTGDDGPVPVENTYLMAMALRKHRVPAEVHVYESGAHGLSLCDETSATKPDFINPGAADWMERAIGFAKRRNA